jgi:uncharacterized protein YecT (DUF1311 family)
MNRVRIFSRAALFCAIIYSGPLLAQTPSLYRDFVPTPDQIAAGVSASYSDCVRLAGVNKSSLSACAAVEQSRADRRLAESYRAALRPLPAPEARTLRIEQQAWLRARKSMCLATVERMNTSDPWGELRKCFLQETVRRQLWIERKV